MVLDPMSAFSVRRAIRVSASAVVRATFPVRMSRYAYTGEAAGPAASRRQSTTTISATPHFDVVGEAGITIASRGAPGRHLSFSSYAAAYAASTAAFSGSV